MFRIEPHIYLSTYSRKVLNQFINENIEIGQIFIHSENEHVLLSKLKSVALSILEKNPKALKYYYNKKQHFCACVLQQKHLEFFLLLKHHLPLTFQLSH